MQHHVTDHATFEKKIFLRGFEEQTQADFIDLVSKALLGASQCPSGTVVGDLCASFCEHFSATLIYLSSENNASHALVILTAFQKTTVKPPELQLDQKEPTPTAPITCFQNLKRSS